MVRFGPTVSLVVASVTDVLLPAASVVIACRLTLPCDSEVASTGPAVNCPLVGVPQVALAAIDPISKLRGVLRRFCPCETAKIKSDLTRQSDNLGTRVSRCALRIHSSVPSTEVNIRLSHTRHLDVNSTKGGISETVGDCIG